MSNKLNLIKIYKYSRIYRYVNLINEVNTIYLTDPAVSARNSVTVMTSVNKFQCPPLTTKSTESSTFYLVFLNVYPHE